jgi:hypothetical protein
MCCISRHDKFVVGGKRLVFYNNSIVKDGGKGIIEEIEPIDADFNEYFNFLVVLTKYLFPTFKIPNSTLDLTSVSTTA